MTFLRSVKNVAVSLVFFAANYSFIFYFAWHQRNLWVADSILTETQETEIWQPVCKQQPVLLKYPLTKTLSSNDLIVIGAFIWPRFDKLFVSLCLFIRKHSRPSLLLKRVVFVCTIVSRIKSFHHCLGPKWRQLHIGFVQDFGRRNLCL